MTKKEYGERKQEIRIAEITEKRMIENRKARRRAVKKARRASR